MKRRMSTRRNAKEEEDVEEMGEKVEKEEEEEEEEEETVGIMGGDVAILVGQIESAFEKYKTGMYMYEHRNDRGIRVQTVRRGRRRNLRADTFCVCVCVCVYAYVRLV